MPAAPLEFLFRTLGLQPTSAHWLLVGERPVRLCVVRHRRARRYILRVRPDGSARVTVPRGGSEAEARRFVERQIPWIEEQLRLQASRPVEPRTWLLGSEILFRGEPVRLQPAVDGMIDHVQFGDQMLRVADPVGNLRPALERHLWRLAARELPARTLELATLHQSPVRRITVRNQRSRWGSCSRRGTISLNWRLIQTPAFVHDYLILHELMHLREMNHSSRFWREVERVCPDYPTAERWLKLHRDLLR